MKKRSPQVDRQFVIWEKSLSTGISLTSCKTTTIRRAIFFVINDHFFETAQNKLYTADEYTTDAIIFLTHCFARHGGASFWQIDKSKHFNTGIVEEDIGLCQSVEVFSESKLLRRQVVVVKTCKDKFIH